MDFDESLAALNIALGDISNVTFTSDEKERALTKAWNDPYVVVTVWDTTLTFSQTTYQYTIPQALTTVKDVYISSSNSTSDAPTKIDAGLWEVVGLNLQFKNNASRFIPQGYTLYLKGNYKITTDDTLDTTTLQEYVIAFAGVETLTLLGFKKANLFLKNDTSMSELIALRREFKQDLADFRRNLPKEYESA